MQCPQSIYLRLCRPFDPRRILHLAALLALLGTEWGTAGAAAGPASSRFEELRQQDIRVAGVAYRLSVANKKICRGDLAPQFGFMAHSLVQYDAADREEAARRFGLAQQVAVMAVVTGSPAQKAGLAAGDSLLTVNGKSLGEGLVAADGQPSWASVERVQQILLAEMRKGEVTLGVSGPEGIRHVTFLADRGCPSNVELVPGDEENAWADGQRVVVSSALLSRCDTDDDLALVIAHELAHNILRHSLRLAASGTSKGGRMGLMGSASAEMRRTEEEADRLAVTMAAAASYDLTGAEAFLGRLMASISGVTLVATHPQPDRRLALLRTEIAAAAAVGQRSPVPSLR
jgi:hypothetical protein